MVKSTDIKNLNSCNCTYCNKFTYLWDMSLCKSFQTKTLWVEVPKNASFVCKKYFKNKIPILKQNLSIYNEGMIITRDPIKRFKSLLSHYFVNGTRKQYGYEWLKNIIKIKHNEINIIEDIGDIVLNNFSKLNFISEPHHFFLQSDFIPDIFWFLKKQLIINIENISNVYRNMPKLNMSSSENILISNDNIEKIKTIYYKDFILHERSK